jgi:hypothetical protein
VSQDLVVPPEIASDKGVLKGTVILTQEFQRMPTSVNGGAKMTCAPQLMLGFRGDGFPPAPAVQPPAARANERKGDRNLIQIRGLGGAAVALR